MGSEKKKRLSPQLVFFVSLIIFVVGLCFSDTEVVKESMILSVTPFIFALIAARSLPNVINKDRF